MFSYNMLMEVPMFVLSRNASYTNIRTSYDNFPGMTNVLEIVQIEAEEHEDRICAAATSRRLGPC
jgi:hypothetical protein